MMNSNKTERIFDESAESYDTLLQENIGKYGRNTSYYSEYKVKLALKYAITKPRNIMDFGCGIDKNIPFLRKHFPESVIAGCDISLKSLTVAEKQNADAKFYSIKEIIVQLERYDLILLANGQDEM